MPLFHFHFSSERKHCKTRQPGVCGVLLLHLTGLVDSTNKIKVMKIHSVGAGLRVTSMLCWNWIPFSSSDPAKTIDYFEKHQNAQFLLIKFLKLKFSQSFLGQITNLNQELRTC